MILKGPNPAQQDGYQFRGAGSANLFCAHCGKHTRLKSNRNVHEEFKRQGSHLWIETPLRCPDQTCANHVPNRSTKERQYRRFGRTRSGSDRWQCCICGKTWSIGKPTLRQRKSHVNLMTFNLLMNKVPINRMMEVLDVGSPTLYGKIDFIYRQCRLFAASRESRLPGMRFDRLYLSTDRQDYMVNWGDRKARKTVQLTAVATADLKSGYLFGLTPNFDASMTQDELEREVFRRGDNLRPFALREYARLWTLSDYQDSVIRSAKSTATARDDLDAPEPIDIGQQLPTTGVQVHADYLMYGHYALLRYLFPNVGKFRFFLDQDPGLLAACFGVFADRVGDRTADVVIADIKKDLSVDVRRGKFAEAKNWFDGQLALNPRLKSHEVRTKIMAERIAAAREASDDPNHALQSAWIAHPFPDMAEPVKRFRYATDYGDYGDEHTANLLIMATLWPVDTVFNVIRRRLTYCERPIRSNRRASGMWQIYAPYDPAMIEKMLFIYRTWHNYVWVSPKTRKTAAERFGLAAGKIRTQDILYFDVRHCIY